MEVGDLIRWKSKLWLVKRIDTGTATAFLESETHDRDILGTDDPCEFLCNPARDWPSVTLPLRRGKVVGVGRGVTPFMWLHDWVKMEEFQMGGKVFLNPKLRLSYGHRLTVTKDDQLSTSVDIPRDFHPAALKAARAVKAAPPPPKREQQAYFDRLLEDDDD